MLLPQSIPQLLAPKKAYYSSIWHPFSLTCTSLLKSFVLLHLIECFSVLLLFRSFFLHCVTIPKEKTRRKQMRGKRCWLNDTYEWINSLHWWFFILFLKILNPDSSNPLNPHHLPSLPQSVTEIWHPLDLFTCSFADEPSSRYLFNYYGRPGSEESVHVFSL